VFDQAGYGGASIDDVIERVGGSRRAIYSLFGSKRELFAAMVSELSSQAVDAVDLPEAAGQSVEAVLMEFGRRYLQLLTDPTTVSLYRAIVAEGTRFPELAATFFERGPGRLAGHIADILTEYVRQGVLDLADCRLAAEHFDGMIRDDLHFRVVLGLRPPPDAAEIERSVETAVRLFLDGCRAPAATHPPAGGP